MNIRVRTNFKDLTSSALQIINQSGEDHTRRGRGVLLEHKIQPKGLSIYYHAIKIQTVTMEQGEKGHKDTVNSNSEESNAYFRDTGHE